MDLINHLQTILAYRLAYSVIERGSRSHYLQTKLQSSRRLVFIHDAKYASVLSPDEMLSGYWSIACRVLVPLLDTKGE